MAKRTFEQKKADLLRISAAAVIRRIDRLKAKHARELEAVFAGLDPELLAAVKAGPCCAAESRLEETARAIDPDPSEPATTADVQATREWLDELSADAEEPGAEAE